jgi:putative phosphoesterase
LLDKVNYLRGGPMPFRIIKERAISFLPPDVDVVIFGHNHSTYNQIIAGKLIFNPGSACCPIPRHSPPSVGLLHINADQVEGEIVNLT